MSIDMYADRHIQLMYSSIVIHSGPIALNLLHNALLRYHCDLEDCWIKLVSRPLVRPGQVIPSILINKLHYADCKFLDFFNTDLEVKSVSEGGKM